MTGAVPALLPVRQRSQAPPRPGLITPADYMVLFAGEKLAGPQSLLRCVRACRGATAAVFSSASIVARACCLRGQAPHGESAVNRC